MTEITTPAIIYRIFKYADRSAIALAISPEYGKFKLFISRAYSRKSGFMTFVPGTVTFLMKENSDLHKFVSFAHEPNFYHYTQTPDIIMRLHLLFDFFDNLYGVGQGCFPFWLLCLKFNEDNYRKVGLYAIYRLLKEAGVMFEFCCSACGAADGDMNLLNGELFCCQCGNSSKHTTDISGKTFVLLKIFGNNDEFRRVEFSRDEELDILRIFHSHAQRVLGKEGAIKSYDIFLSIR